ncbi:MAG: hypothetical protein AAF485_24445 [Chloroflexota bacterium]
MIVEAWSFIALWGDSFSPNRAEAITGLKFTQKHEVGQVGQQGRFRNKPYPFGHAVLKAPETINNDNKIEWLLDTILPHIETIRDLGMTYGKIHVTYGYVSQCNLEYTPEIVDKIARSGLMFTITSWEDEE